MKRSPWNEHRILDTNQIVSPRSSKVNPRDIHNGQSDPVVPVPEVTWLKDVAATCPSQIVVSISSTQVEIPLHRRSDVLDSIVAVAAKQGDETTEKFGPLSSSSDIKSLPVRHRNQ